MPSPAIPIDPLNGVVKRRCGNTRQQLPFKRCFFLGAIDLLSKDGKEFVIGDSIAIEVKASRRVSQRDERGLQALAEDVRLKKRVIVCNESADLLSDSGVEIFPVEEFLDRLWEGGII